MNALRAPASAPRPQAIRSPAVPAAPAGGGVQGRAGSASESGVSCQVHGDHGTGDRPRMLFALAIPLVRERAETLRRLAGYAQMFWIGR
jgi:hypothetical protein